MNKTAIFLFSIGTLTFGQTAESVMEKAANALGGEDVFAKITSSLILGRMIMPQGIQGKIKMYEKDGGKFLMEMNAEAPGMSIEMRQGCDGTDCYSQDSFSGLRLLEGQEKEGLLMQNGLKSHLKWRELYQSLTYKGTEEVHGKKTHKIHALTKGGMDVVNYYDAESYLLVRADIKQQSVMGLVDMVVYFYDYKTTEGINYATRTETEVMGQSIKLHIDSLTVNIPIPEDKFALPTGLKN